MTAGGAIVTVGSVAYKKGIPPMLAFCRKKQSESTFSANAFEKALKLRATFRGLNTIKKLAAKYPPG